MFYFNLKYSLKNKNGDERIIIDRFGVSEKVEGICDGKSWNIKKWQFYLNKDARDCKENVPIDFY